MILTHKDPITGGVIKLIYDESDFSEQFTTKRTDVLTIIWNRDDEQNALIDNEEVRLRSQEVIVLNANQSFQVQNSSGLISWQFNRDFYCIIDHDKEVSCVGLLFYGHKSIPRVELDIAYQQRLNVLFQVFLDEYEEEGDNLKTEMLRAILKRLIVKLTRAYKQQVNLENLADGEMNIVRQFNLLVEQNFRKHHQVQDYVDLIHKSSKTISNVFSKYSTSSPLEIIHQRILLEAKRMLIYTDLSAKEIAYDLGFTDIQGFSRFFKKHALMTPSKYRNSQKKTLIGKN